MRRICPICTETFSVRLDACPGCGSTLSITEHSCYEGRLEDVLAHAPLPVVGRVATLVSGRADLPRGAAMLARSIRRRWHEPAVVAALVRAVGSMKGTIAHDALMDALDHESLVVRAAAAECLQFAPRRAS